MRRTLSAWFLATQVILVASAGCKGSGPNIGNLDNTADSGSLADGGASTDGGTSTDAVLRFWPASISLAMLPASDRTIDISATANRRIDQPVNVAIIDPEGVTTGEVKISASALINTYWAALTVSPKLSPGLHVGTLTVRVCFDDPLTCARPVGGSPGLVAYNILVIDESKYTFPKWENAIDTVPFTDNYAFSAWGQTLIAVAAGFYSGIMETWQSANDGASWTQLTVSGPTPLTRGFALASDGANVYLSGGETLGARSKPLGTYSSGVWKFNGRSWVQQTTSASFPGRSDHAMIKVGEALYVLGGKNPDGELDDAWRSLDDGVTWTRLGTALPASAKGPLCATPWKDGMALVRDGLWLSSDGGAWTDQPGFSDLYRVSASHCAALNGRLYVRGYSTHTFGGSGTLVSSADLATWQFEPSASYGDDAPGLISLNGRLFVGIGMNSSYRPLLRSVK